MLIKISHSAVLASPCDVSRLPGRMILRIRASLVSW